MHMWMDGARPKVLSWGRGDAKEKAKGQGVGPPPIRMCSTAAVVRRSEVGIHASTRYTRRALTTAGQQLLFKTVSCLARRVYLQDGPRV